MKCPNCDARMAQEDKEETVVNGLGVVQNMYLSETWWCPECSYNEVR